MTNGPELVGAIAPDPRHLNPDTRLPFGCRPEHVFSAMMQWIEFLEIVNTALQLKCLARLECTLMPANFSSIVGEFMGATIPKHCKTLVRNEHHNGHPDLIPVGAHPQNAIQHHNEGIEIKGSRSLRGWQGHNPEDTWLMVIVFDSNRPRDAHLPKPFQFLAVLGAQLSKSDWTYSGRSADSRRTITAAVNERGFAKMNANWIYRLPLKS